MEWHLDGDAVDGAVVEDAFDPHAFQLVEIQDNERGTPLSSNETRQAAAAGSYANVSLEDLKRMVAEVSSAQQACSQRQSLPTTVSTGRDANTGVAAAHPMPHMTIGSPQQGMVVSSDDDAILRIAAHLADDAVQSVVASDAITDPSAFSTAAPSSSGGWSVTPEAILATFAARRGCASSDGSESNAEVVNGDDDDHAAGCRASFLDVVRKYGGLKN